MFLSFLLLPAALQSSAEASPVVHPEPPFPGGKQLSVGCVAVESQHLRCSPDAGAAGALNRAEGEGVRAGAWL